MAQGTTKGVPIDIDPLLAADSDLLVPSQKAIKTYVDTGLLTKQGALTLTTTGTSGAATLIANTLNIPQYAGTTRLDQILAATATNTIANANNAQVWNWDTLTTQTALKIASTSVTSGSLLSVASTSNAITTSTGLLNVSYSGTPSTGSVTNYAIYADNNSLGNNSQTRYGVRGGVSGGTLYVGGGTGIAGLFTSSVIGNNGYGVQGIVTGAVNTVACGVYGSSLGPSGGGQSYGVYGINNSGVGYGVYGRSVSTNSATYGVYGIGVTSLNGGASYGGRFRATAITTSSSSVSYGVYGEAVTTGTGGVGYGGYFSSTEASTTNVGLYTTATGGLANNYGLLVAAGSVGIGTTTPTSSVQINGSFAAGYVAKTANYTLTISDRLVNCTANSFTITLPTAVGITGREYIIKNTGTATTITIATTSAQTIDGLIPSTYNVTTLTPLRVMSNGANWITC